MPKCNILYFKGSLIILGYKGCNLVTLSVKKGIANLCAILLICNKYLNLNGCICTVNSGCNLNTGSAEIVKVEVALAYAKDVYVSVKTAVEGKVCHLGIYSVVGSIINCDNKKGFILKRICNINSPCRVTAIVVSKLLTVKIYVRRGVCAIDFKVVAVCNGQICLLYCLNIVTCATVVVVTAVLTVKGIPGVRQANAFKIACYLCGQGGIFSKCPALIKIQNCTH